MTTSTDRIEKKVLLRAPRERVWQAISDAKQFGTWFGVELDGPFVAGKRLVGRIVPTKVDREIAKMQEGYDGTPFDFIVERIQPMDLFSFRWHPFAVEEGIDLAGAPTTLVTFELAEAPGGTHLTITESGFDKVPLDRRAKAFAANDEGWTMQCKLIAAYLDGVRV